ncbi:hypothetical protein GCM10023216_14250 [Isoptericola chiayiensis]|uniref:YtxH domain-containing protein n=1 Tax=Isoptericola chiayiensis TaxID=579446 RepID=A0ABP8YD01_9MICO|nr:hypothetical protein [Isoptericola chiayiensis]NOW02056.1 hypothetical protein [Isoptericola chiayiensis]
MKAFTALVAGLALGYYLGTEKGREQLEQAKQLAVDTWNDPRVQEKVTEVQEKVAKA